MSTLYWLLFPNPTQKAVVLTAIPKLDETCLWILWKNLHLRSTWHEEILMKNSNGKQILLIPSSTYLVEYAKTTFKVCFLRVKFLRLFYMFQYSSVLIHIFFGIFASKMEAYSKCPAPSSAYRGNLSMHQWARCVQLVQWHSGTKLPKMPATISCIVEIRTSSTYFVEYAKMWLI